MGAAIFCLIALGIACGGSKDVPQDLASLRKKEPLATGFSPEIMYSDSARIKARIKARYMYEELDAQNQPIYRAQTSVHMIFYNRQGAQEASLTSDRAILYQQENKMEAFDEVVVTTANGDILETEHLVYLANQQRVYTNQFVKITRPGEIILADSMESTNNMQNYRIFKIRGIIRLKE
jgi:LPS export ABC transporter protein LptC